MAIFNTVPPLAAGPGIKFDGERISTAAAPRNWLDNSDFTNLVAQAGIGGKYGNTAYAADRWIWTSGKISYTPGVGLDVEGQITQKLEHVPDNPSCFVGMVSGTADISINGNEVTITSAGGVIKWAALYDGTYTAETIPRYQPKGKSAELAACKRYAQKLSAYYLDRNVQTLYMCIMFDEMRVMPTLTFENDSQDNLINGTGVWKVSTTGASGKFGDLADTTAQAHWYGSIYLDTNI